MNKAKALEQIKKTYLNTRNRDKEFKQKAEKGYKQLRDGVNKH